MLLVFDDCVLDLDRRELLRASEIVATAPKSSTCSSIWRRTASVWSAGTT